MPKGLKRYYGHEYLHYLTCSCYHRQPWLASESRQDLFLEILEQVRQRYAFVVAGYVVIPDHIHLLISEAERGTQSTVMQVLIQRFARYVLAKKKETKELRRGEPQRVWQRRFYDFHVWNERKRVEKLVVVRFGLRVRPVKQEILHSA
jgi:putative transposase